MTAVHILIIHNKSPKIIIDFLIYFNKDKNNIHASRVTHILYKNKSQHTLK